MTDRPHDTPGAYGWRDFDPEVVEGLVENDSRFVNRRANGWIACPLGGHFGEELAWQEDNYRKGSVLHGSPAASFRAAPTYVLERPLDNLIAGRELIAEAVAVAQRADVVVLAAGLDIAADDPFKGFAIATPEFGIIGKQIAALRIPLLVVQEGGYPSGNLGANLASLLSGLLT
mgnify:CR=1 FL=1